MICGRRDLCVMIMEGRKVNTFFYVIGRTNLYIFGVGSFIYRSKFRKIKAVPRMARQSERGEERNVVLDCSPPEILNDDGFRHAAGESGDEEFVFKPAEEEL